MLTGAGISTDSGIPDFRGPNGLWTRDPEAEKASDIRFYVDDPAVRVRNWARRAAGEPCAAAASSRRRGGQTLPHHGNYFQIARSR